MTNYPKDIFKSYVERQISKNKFIEKLTEWQKANGIDYSFKKTVDDLDVYFTYRHITATIKNNKLHFKTDKNEKADTPFEFRRKVDFYLEYKNKLVNMALSIMDFYFGKAVKAIGNLETNDYHTNIEKAEYWAGIAREKSSCL